MTAAIRTSFLDSDRTYGARRVWYDLLAAGMSCGLHAVERLMRLNALRAWPRRRRLLKDNGARPIAELAANVLDLCSRRIVGWSMSAAMTAELGRPSFSVLTLAGRALFALHVARRANVADLARG